MNTSVLLGSNSGGHFFVVVTVECKICCFPIVSYIGSKNTSVIQRYSAEIWGCVPSENKIILS